MNSTTPADLLELKVRFETWRANRKYVREPIPDSFGARPLNSVGVIRVRSWAVS
jgi:hypothetical protein